MYPSLSFHNTTTFNCKHFQISTCLTLTIAPFCWIYVYLYASLSLICPLICRACKNIRNIITIQTTPQLQLWKVYSLIQTLTYQTMRTLIPANGYYHWKQVQEFVCRFRGKITSNVFMIGIMYMCTLFHHTNHLIKTLILLKYSSTSN
jgi:hypothetical protein